MDVFAVRAEDLGKRYRVGRPPPGYATLRERLSHVREEAPGELPDRGGERVDGAGDGVERRGPGGDGHIWALRHVSFRLRGGEVLGVIGRNGSGKSTLLKVLSRITEPTEGVAHVRGRVGSLLEVGTGFHPELTGRENIYLNGALLGMRRREIEEKFDEIVSFAETGRFLDTPVKRYSSGMRLRLAFSVAAHLEPEILLIDEVLAVGDVMFQRKCLEKMGDTARGGRTVVFVSHDLSAVLRLCTRVILLEDGRVVASGTPSVVVDGFLRGADAGGGERLWADVAGGDIRGFIPRAVRVMDPRERVTDRVLSTEPIRIEIEYELDRPARDLRVGLSLHAESGELVFSSFDRDDPSLYDRHADRAPGRYVSRCEIPADLLNRGTYVVRVRAYDRALNERFLEPYAVRFTVDATGGVGSQWRAERDGAIRPRLPWTVDPVPAGVGVRWRS